MTQLAKKTLIRNKKPLPETLEEAFEILIEYYSNSIEDIKKMTEDEFMSSTHFGAGMFMRNEWLLWWFPNHTYVEWPKDQPKLNEWFESIGIVHADDMSGIILTCLYRKLHNLPFELDKQVKIYHKHWKKNGFPDGIPKHK